MYTHFNFNRDIGVMMETQSTYVTASTTWMIGIQANLIRAANSTLHVRHWQ